MKSYDCIQDTTEAIKMAPRLELEKDAELQPIVVVTA